MSGTLTLLVALMAAEILRSRKIHTDDTSVPVIVPGETKTKKGYFWAYCGDDQHRYSVYDFTLSHCRDGPARWLQGYCGYLQADVYGGYDGIAIQSDGRLKLVGCGATCAAGSSRSGRWRRKWPVRRWPGSASSTSGSGDGRISRKRIATRSVNSTRFRCWASSTTGC